MLDEVHQRNRVDHRIRVRHHHECRDAARCGCIARSLQRLLVLGPRFTRLDAKIDESRREDLALGVDLEVARRRLADPCADIGDDAILDHDAALLIQPGGRINDARVVDNCAAGHAFAPASLGVRATKSGAFFASVSSTAIRTATPISTCSVISERVL